MSTAAGKFGTLCALGVTADVDHVEDSLEALGEFLVEFMAMHDLKNVQLTVLVDPAPADGVVH